MLVRIAKALSVACAVTGAISFVYLAYFISRLPGAEPDPSHARMLGALAAHAVAALGLGWLGYREALGCHEERRRWAWMRAEYPDRDPGPQPRGPQILWVMPIVLLIFVMEHLLVWRDASSVVTPLSFWARLAQLVSGG